MLDGEEQDSPGRRGDATPGRGGDAPATGGTEFPVVGIGASAGGIEALRRLFENIPPDSGMSFMVVQHLSPAHRSLLPETLASFCSMPVVEATNGVHLQPDHVYVITPNVEMRFARGALEVRPRSGGTGRHVPIDICFQSLAAELGARAIGIVLSGTGSDGTEGLKAIREQGGITIAQVPESAQFGGMPESAIEAGVVDYRLAPEAMARDLLRLSRHTYLAAGTSGAPAVDGDPALPRIMARLLEVSGTDFTGYKNSSLGRRIARRMALTRIDALEDYANLLDGSAAETQSLAEEILVHVTTFFRDVEVFDALQRDVFPEILARCNPQTPVKVWVPGCSTGEEVYSTAIALLECVDDVRPDATIQIFGSDLSAPAIEKARAGVFGESAIHGVAPERLARHFTLTSAGYRVNKRVRDACVFVVHDLTRDPPFVKLDLISCRNVLIYFGAELQQRIFPMFHHCLKTPGYLVLGHSEGATGFRDLFTPIERAHRIFAKTGNATRRGLTIGEPRPVAAAERTEPAVPRPRPVVNAQRQADHLLLARYAPPGVVVNDRYEVIQFRGRTGAFLEQAPGNPQSNVLKMAREGLIVELSEALDRAVREGTPVRKENVQSWHDGRAQDIAIEVIPLERKEAPDNRFFLVVFDDSAARPASIAGAPPIADPGAELLRLRQELAGTRQFLQALLDDQQDIHDDAAATNEELIAANEELQSTNEELESAKEELQSSNEELYTLNDELRERNRELDQLASDLANVLDSADLPMVIVGADRRIRRLTPRARAILNIIPSDVGRPIGDIKPNIDVDDLDRRVAAVIDSGTATVTEVRDRDGRWHRMQIRPYRTPAGHMDGAVVSLTDIEGLKRAALEAEAARELAAAVVEGIEVPLVVLDSELEVISVNAAYTALYGPDRAPGAAPARFFELGGGMWDDPALHVLVDDAATGRVAGPRIEIERDVPGSEPRIVSVSARRIAAGGSTALVVALEDVTVRRAVEKERERLFDEEQASRVGAENASRAKDLFLATLSHELRTPLTPVLAAVAMLQADRRLGPDVKQTLALIRRNAETEAQLIDDLLDVERIKRGKITVNRQLCDLATVIRRAVEICMPEATAAGIDLGAEFGPGDLFVDGDPARLQQVFWNLVRNAIRASSPRGSIRVRAWANDQHVIADVVDTGIGIAPGMLPSLFQHFVQSAASGQERSGGLGLGLSISKSLVDLHGGSIEARSEGLGKGATFRVRLPLAPRESGGPRGEELSSRSPGDDVTGLSILLVEDHDDTAFILRQLLGLAGHTVEVASSAEAALRLLAEQAFDVMVSDLGLPDHNGFDLLRDARARGFHLPAIAVSGYGSSQHLADSAAAGFAMHLVKPVDPDRLLDAIQATVRHSTS